MMLGDALGYLYRRLGRLRERTRTSFAPVDASKVAGAEGGSREEQRARFWTSMREGEQEARTRCAANRKDRSEG